MKQYKASDENQVLPLAVSDCWLYSQVAKMTPALEKELLYLQNSDNQI